MTDKTLPFDLAMIRDLVEDHPTPFHIHDERVGIVGEEIIFISNSTPADEFAKARDLGAILNLDDVTHIEFVERYVVLPDLIRLRYNPGRLREGNAIIGKPEEAKYGIAREQLFEAYQLLRAKGVLRFGLHAMIASNELNTDYFIETSRMLFELAVEISERLGIHLEMINLGGGIGIPYRPELDFFHFGRSDIPNKLRQVKAASPRQNCELPHLQSLGQGSRHDSRAPRF